MDMRNQARAIDPKQIASLVQFEQWPAISIYLPVSRIGDQQDPLRYKNSLSQIESRLIKGGMRAPEAREMLASEFSLVEEVGFWKNLGADGLAVFIGAGTVQRYPAPESFKESISLGRRYHIRPLMPLIEGQRSYLILALGRNDLHMFQGDRYRLEEIEMPESAPKNMAEVLQYDDPQRQLQYHTKTGSPSGKRDAMYHGHGGGIDDQGENLERYFQALDQALFPLLEEEGRPVVLTGTEELHGFYRRVSRSKNILQQGISGSINELSPETLRTRGWEIASDYFAREEQQAIDSFRDSLGGTRAADELQSVLVAAVDGRVDSLFVDMDARIWGRFDHETRELTVSDDSDDQLDDLLDEAVFQTLHHDGTVYVRNQKALPTDRAVCALLRY